MKTNRITIASGVLLLVVSFLVDRETFDVQLYDTYFIIGWKMVLLWAALMCVLIGGVGVLLKRKDFSRQ